MQSKAVTIGILWVLLCIGIAACTTLRRTTNEHPLREAHTDMPSGTPEVKPAETTNAAHTKVFVAGTSDDVTRTQAQIKK